MCLEIEISPLSKVCVLTVEYKTGCYSLPDQIIYDNSVKIYVLKISFSVLLKNLKIQILMFNNEFNACNP